MIDTTPVEAIAQLAERAADQTPMYLDDVPGALLVNRVSDSEHVEVTDLESKMAAPNAPRGNAVLHDPAHFVEYVNRLGNEQRTTVWADVDAGTFVAVLDDHRDYATAGWREHTVRLNLRDDPDWLHWIRLDNKLLPQADFARHVEFALHTIIQPAAADMLEVASSLQAHKTASFSQATRLDNGDLQLAYHEETQAKAGNGNIEVPRTFVLSLAPWIGCKAVEVEARLVYNLDRGQLGIGYQLVRPDLVKIDVFESLVATARDNLMTKAVFNGTAPSKLR